MKHILLCAILLISSTSCSSDDKAEEASTEGITPVVEAVEKREVKAKKVEGFTLETTQLKLPVNTVGNVRATKKGK